MHLHLGLVSAFITVLQFLIAWIPIKLLAARYDGKSGLASATLHVL
jgi:hypothetical protein